MRRAELPEASLMRRDLLTTNPREGDYILSPDRPHLEQLRSTGDRGGHTSVGDRDKKTALAKPSRWPKPDRADGWKPPAPDSFWQITRFRAQDWRYSGAGTPHALCNPTQFKNNTDALTVHAPSCRSHRPPGCAAG